MRDFSERLKQEILVSECAMGTMLQGIGLQTGVEFGEEWNLTAREKVQSIHKANIDAGAGIIFTNTFGANRFRLEHYGLAEKSGEINSKAAENIRQIAPDSVYVAGNMGPSGGILEIWGGNKSHEEIYEAFVEQVSALSDGGIDLVIVETMMDLEEAKIAARASKENTNLPVIASMSFDKDRNGYRTPWGISPQMAVEGLAAAGADVVGANCQITIADMVGLAAEFRACTDIPIIVQPNAGNPEMIKGVTYYRQTARDMAKYLDELIAAGPNIVGGCCGTTPEYTELVAEKVK